MDELAQTYAADTTKLWKQLEAIKKMKDESTGEVRDAYVAVMKDMMWRISRDTYQFINEMLALEDGVFTEEEIKRQMSLLMSRFPAQH